MEGKIPVKTIDEVLTQWRSPPKRVLLVVREESDFKFDIIGAFRAYLLEKFGLSYAPESDIKKHRVQNYLVEPGYYMDDPSSEAFFSKEAREEARIDRLSSYLNLSSGVDGKDYDRVVAYRSLYEQLEQKLSSSGVSVVHSNLIGFFKATEILPHTNPSTSVWESNDPTPLESALFGTTSWVSVKDYFVRRFKQRFDTGVYLGGGCFCCSAIRSSEPTLHYLSEIFGNRIIVASSAKNFEGHQKDGIGDDDFGSYLGIRSGTYVAPVLIAI